MTLFYVLILIILAGGGAIAWIMMTEKKKESPIIVEAPKTTEPQLSPKDLLGRLGIENVKPTESKIVLPALFTKTALNNTAIATPQSSPNSTNLTTNSLSTQTESELSLKYDELLTEHKELKAQYAKLETLFTEKSMGLEKSEKSLNNELKNQKEFNKVKDILEKEIKESKDKIRDLQAEVTTAQTETQTQIKRVSQLEEKVKKLEIDVLTSEAAINDGQAGIQLVRKHATELEEKLRTSANQILEKNQKIEDLVSRLKDLPNIFPGNELPPAPPPIKSQIIETAPLPPKFVDEKGGSNENLEPPPAPLEPQREDVPAIATPTPTAEELPKEPAPVDEKTTPLAEEEKPVEAIDPLPKLSEMEKPPEGSLTLRPDIFAKPAPETNVEPDKPKIEPTP